MFCCWIQKVFKLHSAHPSTEHHRPPTHRALHPSTGAALQQNLMPWHRSFPSAWLPAGKNSNTAKQHFTSKVEPKATKRQRDTGQHVSTSWDLSWLPPPVAARSLLWDTGPQFLSGPLCEPSCLAPWPSPSCRLKPGLIHILHASFWIRPEVRAALFEAHTASVGQAAVLLSGSRSTQPHRALPGFWNEILTVTKAPMPPSSPTHLYKVSPRGRMERSCLAGCKHRTSSFSAQSLLQTEIQSHWVRKGADNLFIMAHLIPAVSTPNCAEIFHYCYYILKVTVVNLASNVAFED